MKKKKKILLSTLTVILILVTTIILKTKQEDYKELSKDGNAIAMYIEGEDGEYHLSQDNKFPTDGYVLDIENSGCTNGLTITQDEDTKKISLSAGNSGSCELRFMKERFITLANGLRANLESVTEYEKGDQKEMYTFRHDNLTTTTESYTHSATQVADWSSEERKDYRYIGANPNNYVDFNGETWRIIGVFTVETESGNKEQLIKIIRNESIGEIPWDDLTDGRSTNEWSTASLQTLLNGDYLNTEDSFSYTYKASSSTEEGTTITIPKGLNETARGQIAKVKWYLGGSKTDQNLGYQDYYNFERGETRYNTSNSTYIMQEVGLIYPSDYIYTYANGVNDICYTGGWNCGGTSENSWMKKMFGYTLQWTIASNSAWPNYVFRVRDGGAVRSALGMEGVTIPSVTEPVVYLKSGIKLVNGDGSIDRPYQLGN